jgi:hypothetical protein
MAASVRKYPMMRSLSAVVVFAVLVCSCSSAHSQPPKSAALARAAHSVPAGCTAAMGALPAGDPETSQEASAAEAALDDVPKDSPVAVDAYKLAVDSGFLSLDLQTDQMQAYERDLKTWNADAAVLRAHCS